MSIRNRITQISEKNLFAKSAFILLLFFAFSSCTDQGCIEADDFGEYESQTVVVNANAASESCSYDASKELTDTSQGSGVKICFTSGNTSIIDETNTTLSSTQGCRGFTDAKFRTLCINNCVQTCLTNSSSSSASAEPNWISTDKKVSGKNIGVTVRPGSQVIIRAIGSVTLGDSIVYPDIYVRANQPIPNANNSSWADTFFDARNGQTLAVKFSGQWTDGGDPAVAPSTPIDPQTNVGGGSTALSANGLAASDSLTYNGSRRVVAYLIPHPAGYDFDISQTTEKTGAKVVPLLPDPVVWQCNYSGADTKESTCGNKATGYTDNGYTNVDNSLANSAFPITSTTKSTILTQYGGLIRWNGDGLEDNANDPFAAVNCDGTNGQCSNINDVSADRGKIVGDLSAVGGISITNASTNAVKVSLKSLAANNTCNLNFATLRVQNSSSTTLYSFLSVGVSNAGWTSEQITLEPSQKLVIPQDTTVYNGNGVNCGRVIAARFTKYHDLQMQTSGFVRFTMLHGSNSGGNNCTLKGRIINPSGNHQDIDTNYTADFYEYDPFSAASSADPLNSLTVPPSSSLGVMSWSNRVFLRKGQIIRLSPESWNGTWTASTAGGTFTRKCGIGMAMTIEPRPALLCRGKASDLIDNPTCVPDFTNSGVLRGCQSTSALCSDTASVNYCPVGCQRTISCTDGTSPFYQKTSCSFSASVPTGCTYPADNSYTDTTCLNCKDRMMENSGTAARISVNSIDQCYDLENYTGKVANIPAATNLTRQDIDDILSNSGSYAGKTKGLTRLGTFNGNYGNLQGFKDTGTVEAGNGNKIYQIKFPMTFVKPGRLRFLMLDGFDFNGANGAEAAYANNSITGGSYGGSNGFKITLSGNLEFSNGEWLQARLCKESSNSDTTPSSDCKTANPVAFAGQPLMIEITPPTNLTPLGAQPTLTANYKFDSYGNINRITGAGATGDCDLAANGVATSLGALYYCHTYQYYTNNAFKNLSTADKATVTENIQKMRITFKILDPEIGNCNLVGSNDGITLTNPFYDSTVGANVNTMCSGSGETEIPGDGGANGNTGNRCKKQFYCANKYYNNSGKYYVNVKVKNLAGGTVSSIIGSVIKPVIEVMDGQRDDPTTTEVEPTTIGQAERIYKLLVADPRYKAILTMSLVMMFTFYGFGYLLGVSELNHSEIITRIIKIGLIYLFIGETGWDYFNKIVVKFFKDSTDYLAFLMASSFDDSPDLTNAIANNTFYDKSILFSGVDKVFSLFFSSVVQKKVSALFFASIFGWAYLIIIYMSFMLYVYAVANALLLYLTAQVFISILFTLGPIFFIFTLFNQTKEMFDNWLKQLISFSLQQIFLLTTLAFFNMMMYEVIKMSLGYKICWDEVWTINIITRITLLSFWTIASLPPRTNAQSEVGNIGNPDGIPSLFSILFIWVIASLMKKFIEFMTNLAASMAGGLSASKLGSGLAEFAKSMQKAAGAKMGELWNKTGGEAVRRLDHKLFDSGKYAEEARAKAKKQNAVDQNNKSAMLRSGDKAISDYKKNNAKELMGMTKEEQRKKLSDVRDTAMNAEGKKLGLNDDQIKALRSDTGLKYTGTNVFGAAFQAARQGVTKGGTLTTSVNNRKVETAFSNTEAQQGMKKMTKEERQEFKKAHASGKVEVKKGNIDTIRSGMKSIGSGIRSLPSNIRANKGRAVAAALTLGISEAAIRGSSGLRKSNAEYDEASKQLEAEGVVSRMSPGTAWARNDSEKQLIRQRARLNKDRKQVSTKGVDADAAAALERQDKLLERMEEIDDSDKNIVQKAGSQVAATMRSALRTQDIRAQAIKSTQGSAARNIAQQIASNTDELKEANAERQAIGTELDQVQKELGEKRPQAKVEQLQKTIKEKSRSLAARLRSPEARKSHAEAQAAQKELKKMDSNPEVVALKTKQQKLSVQAHQNDARRAAVGKAAATLIREQKLRSVGAIKGDAEKPARSADHQRLMDDPATKQDKQRAAVLERSDELHTRAAVALTEGTASERKMAQQAMDSYSKAKTSADFEQFNKEFEPQFKKQEETARAADEEYKKLGGASADTIASYVERYQEKTAAPDQAAAADASQASPAPTSAPAAPAPDSSAAPTPTPASTSAPAPVSNPSPATSGPASSPATPTPSSAAAPVASVSASAPAVPTPPASAPAGSTPAGTGGGDGS